MEASWRLLRDPDGSGAWNMAVDESLLEHAAMSPPTLRLYGWRCTTLSLGYRQRDPRWADRCARLGVDVVRRVTGGGAVLHAGDLTYAVVAGNATPGLPADLDGSYEWIRSVLVEALRSLGLDARPSRGTPGAQLLNACFAGATGTEIELGGAKLVGSAQRRTPWGLLQHGSIRLSEDGGLHAALLGVPAPPLVWDPPPMEAVVDALQETFAARVAGGLELATLSPPERRRARERARARSCDALAAPAVSPKKVLQLGR